MCPDCKAMECLRSSALAGKAENAGSGPDRQVPAVRALQEIRPGAGGGAGGAPADSPAPGLAGQGAPAELRGPGGCQCTHPSGLSSSDL